MWGFRVAGLGGFDVGTGVETNVSSSVYTWAGIPALTAPAPIRTTTAAVENESTTIWYGASVEATQAPGNYSQTVTYTAIARD